MTRAVYFPSSQWSVALILTQHFITLKDSVLENSLSIENRRPDCQTKVVAPTVFVHFLCRLYLPLAAVAAAAA